MLFSFAISGLVKDFAKNHTHIYIRVATIKPQKIKDHGFSLNVHSDVFISTSLLNIKRAMGNHEKTKTDNQQYISKKSYSKAYLSAMERAFSISARESI